MPERGDAYGRMLLDHLEGRDAVEIIERDDGYIATSAGAPAFYFEPHRRWPPQQRRALRFARGRVLDVGAGAGRVALHLQERGLEVVAIDVSPGAVEVMRRRGVKDARVLSIDDLGPELGRFDTIVMYGNNFGLFASRAKAKRLLRRFHGLTSERGRIIAESRDIYDTDEADHLEFHRRNRARGRMSGQVRLRARHRRLATPWFDYLMVSREEMAELCDGTGWRVARYVDPEGATYVGVLEKT